MSEKGMWGDRQIVYLTGDGTRRHKAWCANYRSGRCAILDGKCIGSAHCAHYKGKVNENGKVGISIIDPVDDERTTSPEKKYIIDPNSELPPPPPPVGTVWKELYRLAGWGDKLLGEIVMARRNALQFRIGYVREEDLYTFTIESEGTMHKYDKKEAYHGKSVYILDDKRGGEEE